MREHQFSNSGSGKLIAVLVAVIVCAGAAYFGYVMVMQWHEKAVRRNVAQKEAQLAETVGQLENELSRLQQEREATPPAREAATDTPEERIRKVFGEAGENIGADIMESRKAIEAPDCFRLEKQISSFFNYLDQQGYPDAASVEAEGTREVFEQMLADIAENPPLIVGETQDIVSLMHNQAHFFRTLDKKRIALAKYILNADAEILEHAMVNFYEYYVNQGGCGDSEEAAVSLETLYEYAGFFLNTLSGKSYLMRRNSPVRCLTRYYSVRLLDQANKAGLNRFGIDIRPHIRLARDDVSHQNTLLYQDAYIETLNELDAKYSDGDG